MLNSFEAKKTESGDLAIILSDTEEREELARIYQDRGFYAAWAELFEYYNCNGGFTPINPESHYIGLTSDPYIIGESVDITDSGDIAVHGGVWHCRNYACREIIQELIDTGESSLNHAFDCTGDIFRAHYNVTLAEKVQDYKNLI